MKLKELHIHNFKFFSKQDPKSPLLKIDGKNLLIYGENGSGKSTIYWALYTLLESSFKTTDAEVEKYFEYKGPFGLVNINSTKRGNNAFIKAVLSDNATTKEYLISGKLPDIQMMRGNSLARESGMASEFINYKILHGLHQARNSVENDVFEWFGREILPYIITGSRESFSQIFEDLKKGPRQVRDLNGDLIYANPNLRTDPDAGMRANYKYYKNWENRVNRWKIEFGVFLRKINVRANEIIKSDFKQDFDIKLEFIPAKFNVVSTPLTNPNDRAKLNWFDPQIKIQIPRYQGKPNAVKKAHSFLNEAKWTAIGLSIRLAILEDVTYRPSPVDLKCLVMDDILLSLDMSNRDIVLNILINRYVNDYQMMLMTHDRSFYEFSKRKIEVSGKDENWHFIEMFEDDLADFPKPYFKPVKPAVQQAEDYYNQHDYPACGIYLRKEVENLLKKILPASFAKEASRDDPNVYVWKRLNDLILSFPAYCLLDNIDYSQFQDLKTYKDALLNPLAHNDVDAPYFKSELKTLIEVVKKLEKIKKGRQLHPTNTNMNFILRKGDGTFFSVRMKPKESVVLIEEDNQPPRISNFAKCKISGISNNGTVNNAEENFDTLKEAYEEMCSRYGIPPLQDLSRVFDYNGQTFDQKFATL